MAQLLRFDESCDEVFPIDAKSGFSLPELYTLIGCEMVEAVYLDDGRIMLIDEEGKLRKGHLVLLNEPATELLRRAGGMPGDYITGNALICTEEEFQ